MATVKLQNNILSDKVNIFSVHEGVSLEEVVKENIDESIYEGELVECYDLDTGKTYYAPLEENKDSINVIIQVNDKDADLSYIVKENDIVNIVVIPSGDSWSWVGAIIGTLALSIAGGVAGVALAGGILAGAAAWTGFAVGAIVGGVVGFIGGGVLPGMLKKDYKEGSTSGGLDTSRLDDVRGAANQPLIDQPYPLVLGKHLTIPKIVGAPYNDISGEHGDENYINVLYAVGYSPLRITDLKLGEQFVAHNQSWSGNANLKNIWAGTLHGTDANAGSGSDTGDITNIWKNNDVTIEILQQVPDKVVNYGGIYPYAKKQKEVMSDVLFIADGRTMQDIAQGYNISYKGRGLKNGLRTNTIKFSEQYPKALTVELDFPQGLYYTRTLNNKEKKQSETVYGKIPLWFAVQWRVYSDDNDSVDASNPGTLAIPSYDYANKRYNLINGKAKRGWNMFEVLNKKRVGWQPSSIIPPYISVQCSVSCLVTSILIIYTITVESITAYTPLDAPFEISIKINRGLTFGTETLNYTFPANTTRMNIGVSKTSFVGLAGVSVTVHPTSLSYKGGTKSFSSAYKGTQSVSVVVGDINRGTVFDAYNRLYDWLQHGGNSYPYNEINSGWNDMRLFNVENLGGTNANKDGINEFRCILDVDLIEWAQTNLRAPGDTDAQFVDKIKAYFFDSSNSTKCIEVRVVRISPNYIDTTIGNEDHSPTKYYDQFAWVSLTTTMLDGDALMNHNKIEQKRPLSEEDMRKLCVIALRAKTDNVDQLSNTIKKFSCMAESFAPYYNKSLKKWLPENITTKKGYYRYGLVDNVKTWVPITESQYYEDRQNGYTFDGLKSKCVPAGNNYAEEIIKNVICRYEHYESSGRIFIPNNDGTLNYCTNNVASIFLLAGIGPHLGNDALGYSQNNYEQNGIGDFNMESLAKWYKWAEDVTDGSTYPSTGYHLNHAGNRVAHNAGDLVHIYFAANAYIGSTETLKSVFSNIVVAGRAVYTRDYKNRLCVVIDKPEKYPVALINQQNTLKSSYMISYGALPSGLQISFPDENDGYNKNQLYCMADGETLENPKAAIEPYGIKYVTNNNQAWSLGRYYLANRVLNREVVTKQLGMEGASIGLGDLVLVQDDTMLIGTDCGGRITQLIQDDEYIYGFLINTSFHYTGKYQSETQRSEQGVIIMQPKQYGDYRVLKLRLAALNTEITVNDVLYKQRKGNTNVVLFEERISKSQENQEGTFYANKPEVDNIVGFGIIGKECATYRVIKIKPSDRNKYEFTLIKYQEDLYTYGDKLPSFQNNITTPDRSQEDSYNLSSNASQKDVTESINAAANLANGLVTDTFSKVPPVPSNLTVTVDRDKIHFSCVVTGDGINNVEYIVYQIKRHNDTVKDVMGKYAEDYFFDRDSTVDGYPEFEDLRQWQVRAKAVSMYTDDEHNKIESEWTEYASISLESLNKYGQWRIPTITASKEIIDRTVIITASYTGTYRTPLYGTPSTRVKIKRIGNLDCEDDLTNVTEVTEIPENPSVGDIIHYLGEDIEEGGAVVFKHGYYYEYTSQNEWTKAGRNFNEILGIEKDSVYYEPEFNKSVQYSESANNEPNYRKDVQTPYVINTYKVSHTLPLIGQTSRIFKQGNVYTGTFTKDVTDYSTIPQSPEEGDIIHYVGTTIKQGDVVQFLSGGYYLYENSDWVPVYAKSLIVPTTYEYLIQMTNESGNVSNELPVEVTALCTNIADIVHSHEHYKDLYVEKLSAISANIGMISEGGMGDFATRLNYWALSNLSPEDSGTLTGVKRGAFRVGGTDQFFLVEPDENDPNKFNIELRAGSINLTSDVDREGFVNGTYIYEGAPETATRRLHLTSQGIVVESRPDAETSWEQGGTETARIEIDKRDNLIITNADRENIPPFGYQADENDVIYHFDDAQNPTDEEVGEGETPSNPKSLACNGEVVQNDDSTLLNKSCSPSSFRGTASLGSSALSGNIVFFNKAEKVVTSGKGICVNDDTKAVTLENAIPFLTGYNDAMKETSTIDASKTVGEYLGLTQQQVDNGIFY